MRARQVAGAHQKLVGDFSSCKLEGLLEQLYPILQWQGMVVFQPVLKRSKRFLQRANLIGIVNGGLDLELVANDARVLQ